MKNKRVNKQVFLEAFNLMNSERNADFLDELEHKVGEAVLKTKGVEEAYVVSAVEFTSQEKVKFEKELIKLIKREVAVSYKTDSTLLGGFKVMMGDWKIDGSLVYQLQRMQQTLGGS